MRLLALALILVSGVAFAGDWLTASVASYHIERHGQNQFNPGIGIEHQVGPSWRAVAGGYQNSSNNLTLYAGGVRSLYRFGPVQLGTMAALATGYSSKPIPIGGPVLSIEGKHAGVNVILIPAAGGVFGLQLKVPW